MCSGEIGAAVERIVRRLLQAGRSLFPPPLWGGDRGREATRRRRRLLLCTRQRSRLPLPTPHPSLPRQACTRARASAARVGGGDLRPTPSTAASGGYPRSAPASP